MAAKRPFARWLRCQKPHYALHTIVFVALPSCKSLLFTHSQHRFSTSGLLFVSFFILIIPLCEFMIK